MTIDISGLNHIPKALTWLELAEKPSNPVLDIPVDQIVDLPNTYSNNSVLEILGFTLQLDKDGVKSDIFIETDQLCFKHAKGSSIEEMVAYNTFKVNKKIKELERYDIVLAVYINAGIDIYTKKIKFWGKHYELMDIKIADPVQTSSTITIPDIKFLQMLRSAEIISFRIEIANKGDYIRV